MSKVPELDLHDDDVLELTDIVETASTGGSEDESSASASDLDMSFEQELEDLFSDSGSDENATQAPPSSGKGADPFADLEFESGDTIDLEGFELDDSEGEDIVDLGEPLEPAGIDVGEDDDLAATTVLSSRDRDQGLDDLDDLDDFDLGDDESDDLAATTVISGQGDRVADVGDFELEAEDELTLDLGDDDESEDQADAFVEDEDFDISGLDELLGADEGAADDLGPMSSTTDFDEAELELEDVDLEAAPMGGETPQAQPAEPPEEGDDLDVLGLEELISDIELPEDDTAPAEPVGEFNMSDFVEDEGLDFEDITEEPETAAADESEDLIDLDLEDIVEAGSPPAEQTEPVGEESFDFDDDLVDLSDTFDESLGGLEGLEGVIDSGEAAEEPATAEAPAEEWDIELPADELETEIEEPAAEIPAAEEFLMDEELEFEEEPAPSDAAFDLEASMEEPPPAPQPEPEPAAEIPETAEAPEPPAEAVQAVEEPAPVPAAAATTALDQETMEQLVSTLEAMEARINTLEAAAEDRDALMDRVVSLESELEQVNQSANSLEQSLRETMEKFDTSLGENGVVAEMIAERLDTFRQSLDTMEPAKDEELATRVEQLESSLEEARAEQAGRIDELENKAGRLEEIDALAARVEQAPSQDDVQTAASQAAQSTVDERLKQALGEGGEIARSFGDSLEQAIANLRAELTEQLDAVKKTADEAATAQPDEESRSEAVRQSVREELDKELAEDGAAAKALRETVDAAVAGLRTELGERIDAVKKTADEAAEAQPDEESRSEAVRQAIREELDKELAEGGAAAKALRETVDAAVTGLRTELSEQIEAVKKTAEAKPESAGVTEELRASLREELDKELAEGGVVASRIDERIGAMEESARLDNMALESRLSQAINQFGDPDSVPEPVVNAISSGIMEAMDEGGTFHTLLEERIAEVAKERQGDLESLANRLEEVLQTFRDEGVSRKDVESLVGERLATLEESLRGGVLKPEDVGAIVDERTKPAVEDIRTELAKERERLEELVDVRVKELGETVGPAADELRNAAVSALDEALPQFRASLVEELEARLDKQPVSNAAQEAIADAVETRMRDSLAEDSDIYENLVGNLTEQLERVIREGVEQLERKTVSHEDWNVMAARLRQELTAKIENEAAKSAARIIREEISTLLGED